MADEDDKIISLDQRRRAEQARQKAEIAAAAARRKKTNGSGAGPGQGFNRPVGQPMRAGAPRPAGGAARGLGRLMALLVYGGLAATIGLALLGWLFKG
jgi:hypothetical protein